MAPAIRYLSADNHTAATPTAKLVNTEPPSPYFRVIFEVRLLTVCAEYVYLFSSATNRYCGSLALCTYIYIACTCILNSIKT